MTRMWMRGALAALTLGVGATVAGAQPNEPSLDQQEPIRARPGRPDDTPTTDQTVNVVKGSRLVVNNRAGEVIVRVWDRDAIRVEATHSARESVDISTEEMTVRLRTRAPRGPSGMVDYRLTVPRWMPMNLSGTYMEANVEGTSAEVTAETVGGNIRLVGGSGAVSLRSVEGVITIEKSAGKVHASTVNEGIRLVNVQGQILADTINGDIDIDNAQTDSLEVSTVNGDVSFNGTIATNGAIKLTTHDGDIRVGLGGAANATVFVRTFQGDFSADFPIQLPEGQSARSGSKRFNFTLGSGSARIEVQTFDGDIHLARGRVTTKEEERERRRSQRKPGDLARHLDRHDHERDPDPNPDPGPNPDPDLEPRVDVNVDLGDEPIVVVDPVVHIVPDPEGDLPVRVRVKVDVSRQIAPLVRAVTRNVIQIR